MKKILLTSIFTFTFLFGVASVQAYIPSIQLKVNNTLSFKKTLRPGMVNANVLALQKKLKAFGFYHKKLDANYGRGTIAAVKMFQQAKGLKADGIAGPKTFAMILATDEVSLNTGGIKPVKPIAGICTKEYKPVCGVVELQTFAASVSRPQTFSNTCMAKLAHANILYKGKCKITKPTDGLFHIPQIATLEANSAPAENDMQLNGKLLSMGSAGVVQAFYVFGKNRNLVNSVSTTYREFSDIQESGQNLRKEYFINLYQPTDQFAKNVSNLMDSSTYYVSACVQYTDFNNEKYIACGLAKSFETESGSSSSNSQCLEIESDNFGTINDDVNISLNRGDRNKQIGEFIIKNTCNYPISLTDVYFDTLSSFNSASFKNINVEFEDCNATTETDFRPSIHNLNGFGDHLFFETEMNRPCTLDAHEDTAVNIFADIVGTYSYITGKPYYSAFAIGIDDVKYTYGNNEDGGYIEEPIVWSKLITIK